MDKVLQRAKGIFKRNPNPRQLPPGSFPKANADRQAPGTITKPPDQTDEDDDEELQSLKNYNVPQQTQLRGPPNTTVPSRDTSNRSGNTYNSASPLPSNSSGPPIIPFRGTSSGFAPDLPYNSTPNNMNSTSNPGTGGGLPFLPQIQDASSRTPLNDRGPPRNNPPPERNNPPPQRNNMPPPPTNNPPPQRNNMPPPPPTNNTPPPSNNFPPDRNNNPSITSPPNNSRSPLDIFRTGMNLNPTSPPSGARNLDPSSANSQPGMNTRRPSMNDSNNFKNNQQRNRPASRSSSYRYDENNNYNNADDNVSRLELDYPIENVLIDANIPSAIAVKINDAVERDRFGNTHHVHRYTYEPSSQQMSFNNNNNQHKDRHANDNSHHGGTRHIREIHNNNQNPLYNDINPQSSHNHHHHHRDHHNHHHQRRRRSYSDMPIDQYVDELLRTPGSTVIHAKDSDDIQRILNQHLSKTQNASTQPFLDLFQPNNQTIPSQPSINPFQLNNPIIPLQTSTNSFQPSNTTAPAPVFYYTAQALPNDPMRAY
ncbi:unnamed protein product [Adineta steineri]|uniref:Uncharacterized protein n=1 Tax=Adineta steineri TaxID=433720 RepID=A0A815J6Q1_9BILA|nr:unnamed protein product [Adineta steineri]CAF1375150.1 unnamed protein product [Adineta steineri]